MTDLKPCPFCGGTAELTHAALEAAVLAEREACAQYVVDFSESIVDEWAKAQLRHAAQDVRAREP